LRGQPKGGQECGHAGKEDGQGDEKGQGTGVGEGGFGGGGGGFRGGQFLVEVKWWVRLSFEVLVGFSARMKKGLTPPIPGQPPKIVSRIENSQSNPPFPPFHVSHEIAGCNTKSAPTTTPLRTSYLKIPVTSDHPLSIISYYLNANAGEMHCFDTTIVHRQR
jgi:hypothetical protein